MNADELAQQVYNQLERRQRRVVFAESCTAGLIAATLGRIPGVSRFLCGSAVVYREHTKTEWLAVSDADLEKHTAESAQVTAEITRRVLEKTSEAHLALGVTGHLGPNAPPDRDGLIYLAIWGRRESGLRMVAKSQEQLTSSPREKRQIEATALALSLLVECLNTRDEVP